MIISPYVVVIHVLDKCCTEHRGGEMFDRRNKIHSTTKPNKHRGLQRRARNCVNNNEDDDTFEKKFIKAIEGDLSIHFHVFLI